MPKQIIVIHGGNAFASDAEYLEFLKSREVTRKSFSPQKRWKANLPQELGEDFDVLAPRMPNEQNAKYAEWKIWFERMLPLAADEVILLGHSLGGIFLAKYLSENKFPKKINALFIIAAPYYEIAEKGEFALGESLAGISAQCDNIHLYQSQDDPEVPFAEVEKYQKELPGAKMHIFKDRGHFKQKHFPEIVAEIKKLAR